MAERADVFETDVKTYNSTKDYNRDAQRRAEQGWEVSNTAWRQPKSGCMRYLLTGGLALIWKPKEELIVTYRRAKRS